MRHALVFVGIGALVILIGLWMINRNFTPLQDTDTTDTVIPNDTIEDAMTDVFTLKSAAFEHNTFVPSKYTCDGDDVSPPLVWEGAPEGTRSFVLIVDDPDASGGRTWDHWIVFNIPPTTAGVGEGIEPEGVGGASSWGRTGWGGPCPPSGTHRYFFRVYALDTMLQLPEGSSKADIQSAMEGHILAQAELIGLYKRQ